ncbi:unnamed protein product [Urochloa decumbens]|uniref:Uncharacterized protein n=1 Tax=Urochloa decumbens TaxID=240449 RepID=A0ABC8Y1T2_9POAL
MDAKVIVSAYEELPRRRRPVPIRRVAPAAAAARAKAPAPRQAGGGGGYSRRALLLAYAQQLRRRRRGGQQDQQRGPPLLEWGEWKAGRVAGGDVAVMRAGRSWCSRLRSCTRLWIRTFLRGARRIREGASCKK